jgi:hypothetical protein
MNLSQCQLAHNPVTSTTDFLRGHNQDMRGSLGVLHTDWFTSSEL